MAKTTAPPHKRKCSVYQEKLYFLSFKCKVHQNIFESWELHRFCFLSFLLETPRTEYWLHRSCERTQTARGKMSLRRCFDVNPFVENVSSDMSHSGTVAFLTQTLCEKGKQLGFLLNMVVLSQTHTEQD